MYGIYLVLVFTIVHYFSVKSYFSKFWKTLKKLSVKINSHDLKSFIPCQFQDLRDHLE